MKTEIVIENRKAKYDYFIEDTLECGIVLTGTEVKSIRAGLCSLRESWVSIENNELYLKQCYIPKFYASNEFDVDEKRNRKLLVHKKEIIKLNQKIKEKGYTLIPIKMYFSKNGRLKLLIGLAKGKHNYDKRNNLKEQTILKAINRYSKY